jgi:hypothetical protein
MSAPGFYDLLADAPKKPVLQLRRLLLWQKVPFFVIFPLEAEAVKNA